MKIKIKYRITNLFVHKACLANNIIGAESVNSLKIDYKHLGKMRSYQICYVRPSYNYRSSLSRMSNYRQKLSLADLGP